MTTTAVVTGGTVPPAVTSPALNGTNAKASATSGLAGAADKELDIPTLKHVASKSW